MKKISKIALALEIEKNGEGHIIGLFLFVAACSAEFVLILTHLK